MKLFEKIFTGIIVVGLIFKFTFLPGGSILIVFGLFLLAMIYYPLGFLFFNEIPLKRVFKKVSYKGISAARIIGAIGLGMGLATVLVGLLFKIQHFPGANANLFGGLFLTLIVLIIAGMKYRKSKDVFYKKAFVRIAIIGIFGLFIALLPNLAIEKFQYRNYPKYIEALENYVQDQSSQELKEKLDMEHRRVVYSEQDFKAFYPDEEY